MSLINYSGCIECKKGRCNKKMALCNVLPANVCDMIGNYVNDCSRCHWMKDMEEIFFKAFTVEMNDANKPSNQLKFLSLAKKPYLLTHNKITNNDRSFRKYRKEIDRILDKQSVKDKYASNKMRLQIIKSFCKNDSDAVKLTVWGCHSQKQLNSVFSPFFSSDDHTYSYRNKEYKVIDLVKEFLVEYVDGLIGDDKVYCDMKGIREHIDKLFT